jgi:voltage-gated potassium channel
MTRRQSNIVRSVYLSALLDGLQVTWPVLSVLLALKASLGIIVGLIEGWSVGQGVYFAFITGLTIGYGDLVPRQPLTQILAVIIGFFGIILTGLVAALAVRALQATSGARKASEEKVREP